MSDTRLELIEVEDVQPVQQRAMTVATPAQLVQIAVERGADLNYVEKLMELAQRHEANEARKQYNEAFAAFKAEAVKIIKNKSVNDGPLRGKKYAELFAVVNAATPALSKHGLSASWKLTKDDRDWIEVTCTLKHSGGHSESVSMGGPPDEGGAKNKIHARASTVSYLERYTLKAILGLSEQEEDEDGGAGIDELLATWTERAEGAKSSGELDRVAKDGAAAFTKARNVPGFAAFGKVVTAQRQALKGAAQ